MNEKPKTIKDMEQLYDTVYKFEKEHDNLKEFIAKFGTKKEWLFFLKEKG